MFSPPFRVLRSRPRPGAARQRLALAAAPVAAVSMAAVALTGGTALTAQPALATTAAPAVTGVNVSANYSFTTLNDPSDPTFNQLLGINDFGVIAGYFGSGSPAAKHPNQGYRVAPYSAASFVNEDFPGSQQTQVTAINDWGNTVGFYASAAGANYGFLDENGVLSTVSDPKVTSSPAVDQLLGLNDNGKAVGFYNDAKGNSHAYSWDRKTGKFTAIVPPGASSAVATGINDHGTVAGFYTEANGHVAGFIDKAGAWATLEYPGSVNTQVFGINQSGVAVGMYVGAHKQTHGFIYTGGTFKTVDDPNGVGGTVANGLNNLGALVGFYTDAKGNTDGFVANFHVAGVPTGK